MLLILASPHVLSEPSGAGARPVHPIRVESRRCNSLVAIGGIADIGMRWSRKARLRKTHNGRVSALLLYNANHAARQSALLNDAPHLNTWLGRFAIPVGSGVLRPHGDFSSLDRTWPRQVRGAPDRWVCFAPQASRRRVMIKLVAVAIEGRDRNDVVLLTCQRHCRATDVTLLIRTFISTGRRAVALPAWQVSKNHNG